VLPEQRLEALEFYAKRIKFQACLKRNLWFIISYLRLIILHYIVIGYITLAIYYIAIVIYYMAVAIYYITLVFLYMILQMRFR
jgi:hypothetical protein